MSTVPEFHFSSSHLRNPRATSVRSEHLDQADGEESKGQSPVDVHEVVHNVRARTLQRDEEGRNRGIKQAGTYNVIIYGCSDTEKAEF